MRPTRVRHNCSGKHALGLARCLAEGWPLDGYFRMGSNTKTFVAVVVLQLAGEHRLSLDDTVDRFVGAPGLLGHGATLGPSCAGKQLP